MLSKTLRHEPERIGISLDARGWVDVDTLLKAFERKGMQITAEELNFLVEHNDKQRFIIDNGRIRANQGHSIEIDLDLPPASPPTLLFHGTGHHSVDSILRDGLLAGSRRHVHLSVDTTTARKVGSRHGRPVIFTVLANRLQDAGTVFYRSANGVWLVDTVPPEYLRLSIDK